MRKRSLVEAVSYYGKALQTRLYTALISRAFWSIGRGTLVVPPFRFSNLHLVCLGQMVTIREQGWILTLGNTGNEDSPKIVIGDGTNIGPRATIAAARCVRIGRRVLFAGNVYVSDHGHAYDDIRTAVLDQGLRTIREVSIGDGSWIGQNAVILPGSAIGKQCVIGANAVVSGAIPDYSVAAGIPARVIKRYVAATDTWEKPL